MTTDAVILRDAVAGYARRLHAAAGPGHHVASPLGAWLLLALCAPATRNAAVPGPALADVLGCDVDVAARLAAGLLARPHPQVAAAAAAWTRDRPDLTEVQRRWQSGLPAAVATGPVPAQAAADAWARDHTFGLIERFPGRISPLTYLVLATALATRVSWQVPFDLAPAADLGAASPWAALGRVLRTPTRPGGSGHRQFIVATPEAGDVIVQLAQARDGLLVASVAAAADVPCGDALAAAQRLGSAAVTGAAVTPRPLADLPLGETPQWRIWEEAAGSGGTGDRITAVLPAWSARSELDLAGPGLGFDAAAAALAGGDPWTAAQSAMARYTRTGFEAAAVSAVAIAASARRPLAGRRRVAELRFGQPYAVAAVAVDLDGDGRPGLWHGIPVFSAWVADPQDAADGAEQR
ncbi:MAG TPA: hypothetical protein VK599_03420 [Streptosporangiaceae bacterium]|nr:hypothetical protein [Streptosporangiaceae bacterium]